jgi:hypothetical protein
VEERMAFEDDAWRGIREREKRLMMEISGGG